MDYRERGSHAQGVYPTQYTSRMGTVRIKQKEETDTRITQESSKKSGRKERGRAKVLLSSPRDASSPTID